MESRTVTERKETSVVDSLMKPGPVGVAPAVLVVSVMVAGLLMVSR